MSEWEDPRSALRARFAEQGVTVLVDWDSDDLTEQQRMARYSFCQVCGRALATRSTWTLSEDGRISGQLDMLCRYDHDDYPLWLWWLSFTDPAKTPPPDEQVPGGQSFLGVVIVEAPTLEDAITRSHLLGANPGGEVAVMGPLTPGSIGEEWRDRLLTADEVDAIPEPS